MTPEDRPALPEEIRRQLQSLGVRRGRDLPPDSPPKPPFSPSTELEGHLVQTAGGSCFVVEQAYPVDYQHGHWSLGAVLQEELDGWIELATGREGSVSPSGLTFLDIETTGLADSASTYAFLVGAGRFEGDSFVLRQLFMRSPGEELALLLTLADLLHGMAGVVTFNGRGFDLPVLHSRFTLSRLADPWAGQVHLDLLLPARRLWRYRLASCSLSSLEEHMLGVQRSFLDIPGWRIPSVYRDYVRGAGGDLLKPIFYHNAQDVLSMVTLCTRLSRFLRDPLGEGGARHGLEFLALGRLYEKEGQADQAIAAYRSALLLAMPAGIREQTWERLSMLLKRTGAWAEAVEIWETLLSRPGNHPLHAFVELAKYYEHRCRDRARAADVTRRAIAEYGDEAEGEDLAARLARLEGKLIR